MSFDLMSGMDIARTAPTVCYNTDTKFDLQVGNVVRGKENKWYINGGYSNAISGWLAFGGYFKSTLAGSLAVRLTEIYDATCIIGDSEDAISRDRERLQRFRGFHPHAVGFDFGKQVVCLDCKVEYDVASFLRFILELGEKKLKNIKDLTITTPFLDQLTGAFIKTVAPTVIFLDSVTEMYSQEELTQITVGLDDKKTKTVYMVDANQKTMLLRWLSKFATKYGFVCVCTAHFGETLNLDSYGPTPKQLQYMKQGCKAKGVGSKFNFLTSPQMQIVSAKVLQDDKKEAWYKFGETPDTDVNELGVQVQRCKNNVSGSVSEYVVSQTYGLLSETTDYNDLRNAKMYGLKGNLQNHQLYLRPDKNITRNSIRQTASEDPRFVRAMQLTAQLLFIQTRWQLDTIPFDCTLQPEQLMEKLTSDKNKMTVDRVLESRGYWLPDEIKSEKEYLSIFDVLEFLKFNDKK